MTLQGSGFRRCREIIYAERLVFFFRCGSGKQMVLLISSLIQQMVKVEVLAIKRSI